MARIVTPMATRIPVRMSVGIAALLAALAFCSSFALAEGKPVAVSESEAARLVSVFRSASGLGPVRVDPRLTAIAASQALAMASEDKLSHSVGGSLKRRFSAGGYAWKAAAENVGAGYPSLAAAMRGWEASSGHRKNLLNRAVTEMGIGAAAAPPGSRYRFYWALVLAAPRT